MNSETTKNTSETVKGESVAVHTPTPWMIHERTGRFQITPADNKFLTCAATSGFNYHEAKANAEFIVLAVNCHDDLLEACKVALATVERLEVKHGAFSSVQGTKDVLNAAITRATRCHQ